MLQLFHEHTRFVYCVRYNAVGSLFASSGADGKVWLILLRDFILYCSLGAALIISSIEL